MFVVQNGRRLNLRSSQRDGKTSYSFLALSSWGLRLTRERVDPAWRGEISPFETVAVHRLLFHNCGYFDRETPLDRRYSIPRWLLPPLQIPLPPFYFSCPDSIYIYTFVCVCVCAVELSPRVSTSLSIRLPFLFLFSLNRITGLFFQAPWIEPEAVYSHVMERRLPRDISTLILCECDWIGYCRLSW